MKKIITIIFLSLVLGACQSVPNEESDIEQVDIIKEDYLILVNKKHPLSKNDKPLENKKAKDQLLMLIEAMRDDGLDVSDYYSGYRDFETQEALYDNYVNDYGQEAADTFSARPGFSEHQSGLAFDLFHNDGSFLERSLEAEWLEEHAHNYGFIVRYQKDKETITGYQHEPWHLRYVGDASKEIYDKNLSLEEFLNKEGGDYKSK